MACFASLEDPRIERSKRHKLLDIIAIAICATICGADSWVFVELFGRSKEEWFRTFLELPGASHLTTPSAKCSPALTRSSSKVALWNGPGRWPIWPKGSGGH